jgi:nitrate reductase gamma subunit
MVHVVLYIRGLDWRLDRVTYTKNRAYGIRGAARSVFFWLLPFGTRSWRNNPGFTLVFFLFHFGLVFTPIFLKAHNLILWERWGFSLWTIPDALADALTILVIAMGLILLLRRIALPQVRILTGAHDILILIMAVLPFVTGFLAFHQVTDPSFWLIAHVLSGELLLIAIPLSKLSHVVKFFCSRIQLGIDFGVKRGGMKSGGMKW